MQKFLQKFAAARIRSEIATILVQIWGIIPQKEKM